MTHTTTDIQFMKTKYDLRVQLIKCVLHVVEK